jgi:WD40 repeat protein
MLLCAAIFIHGVASAFEEDAATAPVLKPSLSLSHSSKITAIDFNDRLIVSGSEDGEVKLFARDGKLLSGFKEHISPILGVAFLGEEFIISVDSTQVILWNLPLARRAPLKFRNENGRNIQINTVAISSRFKRLAVAAPGLLQVIDLTTGDTLQSFTGIGDPRSIEISDSGKFLCLVSGSYSHEFIYIIDLEQGTLANKVRHDGNVRRASFLDDSRLIVLQRKKGSQDPMLRLVDLTTQADLAAYGQTHTSVQSAIAYADDLMVYADDVFERVSFTYEPGMSFTSSYSLFKPSMPSNSGLNWSKIDGQTGLLALLTNDGTAFLYDFGKVLEKEAALRDRALQMEREFFQSKPADEAPRPEPSLTIGVASQEGFAPFTVSVDIEPANLPGPVQQLALDPGDGKPQVLHSDTLSCKYAYRQPGTYMLRAAVQTEAGVVLSNKIAITVKPMTFEQYPKDMQQESEKSMQQ